MKRVTAAILALLILLVPVFTASCTSGNAEESELIGTWKTKIGFDDVIGAVESEDFSKLIEKLKIDMADESVSAELEFKKNSRFSFTVDKDSLRDSMTAFYDKAVAAMSAEYGISEEKVLEDAGFKSKDEMVDKAIKSFVTSSSGEYTYTSGKLTIQKTDYNVVLDESEIVLQEITSEEAEPEIPLLNSTFLPLTFVKEK